MRIAICSWESLHSIVVGGMSVHVTELAAALDRAGHEVHVFTRRGPHQPPYQQIDGVHHHRVVYASNRDFVEETLNMNRAMIDEIWRVEDSRKIAFDVVHSHDWLCSSAGEWAKKGRGRRFVLTIHSTEFGRTGNNMHGGISARIRHHEWLGCYESARIITVSAALRDELTWLFQVPAGKLSVIYNAINYQQFDGPCDPGIIKSQIGIGPWDPMILFNGRMTSQKGPDILMESLPDLHGMNPKAKFVFMGDGDLRGGLQQRARELKMEHLCRFVGHRTGRGLVEIYRAADIVAVPSRSEPFALPILEAWSAYKPVVSTNVGSPNEFIWHGVTGLKTAPEKNPLTETMVDAMSDWDRARWMGQNGRIAVERTFSWDRVAEETAAVYQS